MAKRIVIPARLASTRLPEKVLCDIGGKPMLQHVYERAMQCGFSSVMIAADHADIVSAAEQFGASVCLTSVDHASGTDRAAEVMKKQGYAEDDIIVVLQADEPFIPVANIQQVAALLEQHKESDVATLSEQIEAIGQMMNPHCVKVVCDVNGHAMYFSRAPIPWHREAFPDTLPSSMSAQLHVGIYAYRGDFLRHYSSLQPCALEQHEALEQLRGLWYGHKIQVAQAQAHNPLGVNTPEELEQARQYFAAQGG